MKRVLKGILKFLKILLIVVFSALLAINVYLIFAKFVLKQELPMFLGYSSATVISGSMAETINVGDLVVIKELKNTDEYQTGDVVIYYTGKSFVTHRIIERNGESIVTQGDANNTPDSPIDISQIRGKIVKVLPKVGDIIQPIRNPIVLVLVLVLIFLAFEAINIFTDRNKKKQSENEK